MREHRNVKGRSYALRVRKEIIVALSPENYLGTAGCPAPIIKRLLCFLVIIAFYPILARPAVYNVIAASNPATVNISPLNAIPTHYSQAEIDQMLVGTKNTYDLRKLIQCESQNTNIARMDSNHLMSYGILQFNGTSTWDTFAAHVKLSSSTPMNPASAIAVADWMISRGFLDRWTCARIQKLL